MPLCSIHFFPWFRTAYFLPWIFSSGRRNHCCILPGDFVILEACIILIFIPERSIGFCFGLFRIDFVISHKLEPVGSFYRFLLKLMMFLLLIEIYRAKHRVLRWCCRHNGKDQPLSQAWFFWNRFCFQCLCKFLFGKICAAVLHQFCLSSNCMPALSFFCWCCGKGEPLYNVRRNRLRKAWWSRYRF